MDTASPELKSLCCKLIEEFYGSFYRVIFEQLISTSRLTALQIAHNCHIPLRQVKTGLSALIDASLVYHHSVHDGPTTYTANVRETYQLIRAGKLVQIVHNAYDEISAILIELACETRFCTVEELCERALQHDLFTQQSLGKHEVLRAINTLLDDGYLIHLRTAHFNTFNDLQRGIEAEIGNVAMSRVTGTKAKQEHEEFVKGAVADRVSTMISEHGWSTKDGSINGTPGVSNGGSPAERVMLTNGHSEHNSKLIQPNFYKVVVRSQCQCIKSAVARSHGMREAIVMDHLVRQVANRDQWTPNRTEQVNSKTLRESLLRSGSAGSQTRELKNGHVATNGSLQNDTDTMSVTEIDQSMARLSESFLPFLHRLGNAWEVGRHNMDDHIARQELLRLVDSRIAPPGPRILRILIEKGRLEERTLQELGLLGAKELRQSLASMKQMGYLDLQEVPRNLQRQPNQTVFLWFYDHGRVKKNVLESIYKTMTRLLQLLTLERQKMSSTMAKLQREDVRGREEQALGEAEYAMLSRFRRVETWVWSEITRLDISVAVLRDVPCLVAE